MKVFTTCLTFLLLTHSTFASKVVAVVAVVGEVTGNAFYSESGKTKPLTAGTHLSAQAEIFTEVGTQVSLNDYYDHIYHLSGGGHLVIHNNLIELKEGYLWVKSLAYDELRGPLRINTANSIVEVTEGEAIVSFDTYSGKTQALAVKGDFLFKNSLLENFMTILAEGQFSFIHNEHEQGRPRKPTPIGYSSFQKITSLFKGVEPGEDSRAINQKTRMAHLPPATKKVVKRQVASVKVNDSFEQALSVKRQGHQVGFEAEQEAGKITVRKLRDPASVKAHQGMVKNFYQQKIDKMLTPKPKKKWHPSYNKGSNVSIRIFGAKKSARVPASVKKAYRPSYMEVKPGAKKAKSRTPASIGGMGPSLNTGNSSFESELVDQYKNQMRHDKEVNDLIDQLRSVDMDYKKDY